METEQLVFISYSRSEMYYAEAVNSALQLAGINAWFDLQELTPGSSWLEEIEQGLNACTELLLVVSRISLQSPWVAKEYEHALENEKPVHLLLMEAVPFEDESAQNLLAKATSVIDARQHFGQTMTRLIDALRGKTPTRDAVPVPNQYGIPTRLPLSVGIVAGGMLLLIAMLLFLSVVSLQIYFPATIGSLLFTGLVASELVRFLTRKSYTGTRFTLFFAGLFALLILPILSPVFFAIWLVSLLSRDMTRWSPRGEGVRRGNESLPMLIGRLLLRIAPFFAGLLRVWFVVSSAIVIAVLITQFVISPMFRGNGGGFFILIIIIGLLLGSIYLINRLLNWLIPERMLQVVPFVMQFVVIVIMGLLFSNQWDDSQLSISVGGLVAWVVSSWIMLQLIRSIKNRYFPATPITTGRIYRLVHDYNDSELALRIMEVLGDIGYRHQEKYARQPVDYNILLLTDHTDFLTRDLDFTQGRWIVLVGSQLEQQDWHQQISNYQWVDFRRQDMDQLRIMARDLSDPTISRVSHDFSTRTTPQSFEQVVLPLRVKVYALMQSAFFIITIVMITRQMNSFTDLSLFELIILMFQIVGTGSSLWILNRVMRRRITISEIMLINGGIAIASFLFGLFWGLAQPLPYGYTRDWGALMSSLISMGIGATIGTFIGYQLLRWILGSWLPSQQRLAESFIMWERDRQLFIRNGLTILFVGIITLTLLGSPISYRTPLTVAAASPDQQVRTVREDIPLSAVIRRVNGTAGHATADAINSLLSFSLTQGNFR
jgi:hypothetical protein